VLKQIEDSILKQEIGPTTKYNEEYIAEESTELKGLITYNKERDENFVNFYFLNPQVIAVSAFSLVRGGLF
jgi:hypothetical protein